MRFRLTPRWMTLDDLDLLQTKLELSQIFARFRRLDLGANDS